jgi:predicted GIY-YIG superfamily endonuclease
MYYVYLLKSVKNSTTYIGYTKDLRGRLLLHNQGKVYSTTKGKPWILVYYEAYFDKSDATEREKMLKQDGRSKTWLKKRVEKSLKGAA